MARTVKTQGKCVGCGIDTYRKGERDRLYRCFDCSMRRMVEAAVQMRECDGPFHDRWLSAVPPMTDDIITGDTPAQP